MNENKQAYAALRQLTDYAVSSLDGVFVVMRKRKLLHT
jgi:hypothetical protein